MIFNKGFVWDLVGIIIIVVIIINIIIMKERLLILHIINLIKVSRVPLCPYVNGGRGRGVNKKIKL